MVNTIFDYDSYKKFVSTWLKHMPRNGHGQLSRIAKHLGISSVSVSHIFNGPRDLSEEQALELAEFLGLSELESDYFLLLVQHERAGTQKLKNKIAAKLTKIRHEAQDLKSRLTQDMEVDDAAKALFYSNWFFSGIRLATSIKGLQEVESLSDYLGLPRGRVREILEFLVKYGLVVMEKSQFHMGAKRTHLSANSLLISRHHANWRLKGLQSMNDISPEELFYTGPMTLSLETMREIRKDLVGLIDNIVKKIEPSPAEQLACLNIDWFKVHAKK